MYQSLDIFQTAAAMARHAGQRQAVTAANVAQADTPGYRARHIAPFADVWENAPPHRMKATRPSHLSPTGPATLARATDGTAEPSPNGNSVSIEEEMMHAVNIAREHNRALTIYRHGMTILRSTLGR